MSLDKYLGYGINQLNLTHFPLVVVYSTPQPRYYHEILMDAKAFNRQNKRVASYFSHHPYQINNILPLPN